MLSRPAFAIPINLARLSRHFSAYNTLRMSSPYSVVATDKAPAAIGPYVQAVKSNGTIYASGCIPLVPETMEVIKGGIEEQSAQVFKNAKAVLEASGSATSHVLKTTVFLQSMGDFAAFNKLYEEFFAPYKPARSCVEVAALPKGVAVEMEFIALEK